MVGRRTIIRLANCPMVVKGQKSALQIVRWWVEGQKSALQIVRWWVEGQISALQIVRWWVEGQIFCLQIVRWWVEGANCHIIYRESSVNPSPRRPSSRSGGSQTARGSVFRREVAGRADRVHCDLPFYQRCKLLRMQCLQVMMSAPRGSSNSKAGASFSVPCSV